jgi:hypothetical protein
MAGLEETTFQPEPDEMDKEREEGDESVAFTNRGR